MASLQLQSTGKNLQLISKTAIWLCLALERLHALAERVWHAMEGMRESGWDLKALEIAGIDARLDTSCEWAKR